MSAIPHSKPARWAILVAGSLALAGLLSLLQMPAALLLGAMAMAILVAVRSVPLSIPDLPFRFAQALVGCLIANSITPAIVTTIASGWPLFLGCILSVVGVSTLLGFALARAGVLPGTAAIWGASPGGATAIVLMAEAAGADARLVAFMQYLRVIFVALVASVLSRVWIGAHGTARPAAWLPEVAPAALAATLAIAGLGALAGTYVRGSMGALLLPLALGALLQDMGMVTLALPPWLMAPAYLVIGWRIGMSFNREIVTHAARALPRVAASILTLIALCGGLALLLVKFAAVDPLTAYLATSPGGADAIAIIAASTKVDLPFVMAMQTGRFLIVLVLAAPLARWGARFARDRPR